jgi:hypothetical protein
MGPEDEGRIAMAKKQVQGVEDYKGAAAGWGALKAVVGSNGEAYDAGFLCGPYGERTLGLA